MLLRPGITNGAAASGVPFSEFKRDVYAAALKAGAEVRSVVAPSGVHQSYYSCVLRRRAVDVVVLVQKHAGLVAFASGRSTSGFEFVDDPQLAAAFGPRPVAEKRALDVRVDVALEEVRGALDEAEWTLTASATCFSTNGTDPKSGGSLVRAIGVVTREAARERARCKSATYAEKHAARSQPDQPTRACALARRPRVASVETPAAFSQ